MNPKQELSQLDLGRELLASWPSLDFPPCAQATLQVLKNLRSQGLSDRTTLSVLTQEQWASLSLPLGLSNALKDTLRIDWNASESGAEEAAQLGSRGFDLKEYKVQAAKGKGKPMYSVPTLQVRGVGWFSSKHYGPVFCLLVITPSEGNKGFLGCFKTDRAHKVHIACFKREPDKIDKDNLRWIGEQDSFFVGAHTVKSGCSLSKPELETSKGLFTAMDDMLIPGYPFPIQRYPIPEEDIHSPIPTAGAVLKKLESGTKNFDDYYTSGGLCWLSKFGEWYEATSLRNDTAQDKPSLAVNIIPRSIVTLECVANQIAVMQEMNGKSHMMSVIDFYIDAKKVCIVHPRIQYLGLFGGRTCFKKASEKTQVRLVSEILQELKHLHERNIIHNDISAKTIGLTRKPPKGHAVLGEFFWSQQYVPGKCKICCGYPPYAAPEKWDRNSGGYDLKVDIWAVGMLTLDMMLSWTPTNALGEIHIACFPEKGVEWFKTFDIQKELKSRTKQLSTPKEAFNFLHATLQKDPSLRCDVDGAIKLVKTWFKAIPDG